MTELDDLAAAGYCTDEWKRWQQGHCGTYAVALIRLQPGLRFGTAGYTENGDPADGWRPAHHFAHDDQYAYDSAGRHRLPYAGVHDDLDYYELNGDAADWGLPDEEGSDESDLLAAEDHARRHGILAGRHGPDAPNGRSSFWVITQEQETSL